MHSKETDQALHWVCQACKQPLRPKGLILIYNANPELGPVGSYPKAASPESDPTEPTDTYPIATDPPVITADEASQQYRATLRSSQRPANVGFGAYHPGCDPYRRDLDPYWFYAPNRLESWVSWVLHLSENKWMGRSDLLRMLRFWWTHKIEEPPPL